MDPNETRKLMLELSSQGLDSNCASTLTFDEFTSLCQHVADMDEWLTKGGMLPDAWSNHTRKQPHFKDEKEFLICSICSESVCVNDLRDHLEQHTPVARNLDWNQIRNQFYRG